MALPNRIFHSIDCARCGRPVDRFACDIDFCADALVIAVECHGETGSLSIPRHDIETLRAPVRLLFTGRIDPAALAAT